ncbi:MAG TPA: 8-amino-7-oxononanoate synthase [Myxococcota bacterium]|nr:8-amino-7-oxononanoate synthase [Myxococcota bacterium]
MSRAAQRLGGSAARAVGAGSGVIAGAEPRYGNDATPVPATGPSDGGALDRLADELLGGIRERGTYRRMRVLEGVQAPRMTVDGRDVLLFAGSNYLDLARHPEVVAAAERGTRQWGCAAGGSRLITGNLACHEALEAELAAFFGREAALAFNTGYMANVGVIPALVGPGDVLVSDALNHASIIDGARLARCDVEVFAHGDVDAFGQTLAAARARARRVLVAVDGVYSMDGDVAPVAEIVRRAREVDAIVLLDDAHGTGCLGARGRGTAEQAGVLGEVDVLMGTLGKSLGSFGAFVVGSSRLRELLVNTARSFIFSCALAPAQVEAARAALRLVDAEPWRRARLAANCDRLRARLADAGLSTAPSTTHILPLVLGDNARTMAVCEALLERGFYAQGIRHPSVPQGTARLRITPMATHEPHEIDALADALVGLVGDPAPSGD